MIVLALLLICCVISSMILNLSEMKKLDFMNDKAQSMFKST